VSAQLRTAVVTASWLRWAMSTNWSVGAVIIHVLSMSVGFVNQTMQRR
jgi:hypothetical protein